MSAANKGSGGVPDCVIRPAGAADFSSAADLTDQVQALHAARRPDIYAPCSGLLTPAAFAQRLADGGCLVAETGGRVIGMMEFCFRRIEAPSHVTRSVLFIETIVVDQAHRGRGVGRALLERAIQLRQEKGLDGIELQVNAKNTAAYQMYAHLGFTPKSINMELL